MCPGIASLLLLFFDVIPQIRREIGWSLPCQKKVNISVKIFCANHSELADTLCVNDRLVSRMVFGTLEMKPDVVEVAAIDPHLDETRA